MSNKIAPEGHVYVCCACGKRSKDQYGDQSLDWGWDVSCVLNCALFKESQLEYNEDGRVKKINGEPLNDRN